MIETIKINAYTEEDSAIIAKMQDPNQGITSIEFDQLMKSLSTKYGVGVEERFLEENKELLKPDKKTGILSWMKRGETTNGQTDTKDPNYRKNQ